MKSISPLANILVKGLYGDYEGKNESILTMPWHNDRGHLTRFTALLLVQRTLLHTINTISMIHVLQINSKREDEQGGEGGGEEVGGGGEEGG